MFRRGDPRPDGYAWQMMTLAKCMRSGLLFRLECDDCKRMATRSAPWLAIWYDVSFEITIYDLVQRCVCSRCGSKNVSISTVNNGYQGR